MPLGIEAAGDRPDGVAATVSGLKLLRPDAHPFVWAQREGKAAGGNDHLGPIAHGLAHQLTYQARIKDIAPETDGMRPELFNMHGIGAVPGQGKKGGNAAMGIDAVHGNLHRLMFQAKRRG